MMKEANFIHVLYHFLKHLPLLDAYQNGNLLNDKWFQVKYGFETIIESFENQLKLQPAQRAPRAQQQRCLDSPQARYVMLK